MSDDAQSICQREGHHLILGSGTSSDSVIWAEHCHRCGLPTPTMEVLPAMAAAAASQPNARTTAEDAVRIFIEGTPADKSCSLSRHEPATELQKLIALKFLLLEFPRLSPHPNAVEAAIRKALK